MTEFDVLLWGMIATLLGGNERVAFKEAAAGLTVLGTELGNDWSGALVGLVHDRKRDMEQEVSASPSGGRGRG